MKSINWPSRYLPGNTDNFVSNEVIVKNLTVEQVWAYLVDTSKWEGYYDNAANIVLTDQSTSDLQQGERFHFDTFGFPIEAQVMELVEPQDNQIARISWHGWQDGDENTALDVYHAFLLEALPGNRVRVLTQESQLGKPAADMANETPNPMLNGHQAWLDGLVNAARKGA
ncbi:SRPBCC domain-containing protein [Lactiplantibacillus mudanjiangensis]|uniref:Polyketide cyclase [Lactobacillus sp.] n=1 Tax=Lactiplantibacillus mudanjiangensis TaxID=1296538 RepID=A0A660E6M1_9LACO|nr:SRPBCC domain-containing protein [Lactiplantibacillus mudanjiangensis]VDG18513.1 polyketide cyclase [Lactobacillus sp.] [Lactiplantibacillus mudanjiangensis]VDG25896.1 polyketide cyclase [Lactobacillus sp.] [Lactiplantibacillus mudanjiangensis]VDG28671.1 polyketide cyclase [Lactobacillus sp.] [Lactiplantibacillus mudanjiangensis]VDG33729.1 polyketide cyclase [Lactobacillus sp.] [Lactiplantibacillus mudanjiangensis]